MKEILCAVLALFLLVQVSAQQSSAKLPKLSPRTQQYLLQLKKASGKLSPQPDYAYKKTAEGIFMSAMVKVSSISAQSEIEALGGHVNTKAGNIWTVQIPINNVAAFTTTPDISYIELDELVTMKLDSVRKVTHVDSVQKGIGLPMPYTGKGVVVGVVDAGFDFTHPVLYDTSGGSYRVKRVWLEKATGTPPSGFNYGSELTDAIAIKAAQTDNNTFSHGMHVTGIAAGSGHGSTVNTNYKYRGMAFESDVVLVGIMPDSTQWQNTGMSDFIDGINYVFQYAQSVGKPAVVNLSWGSPSGPHDGTSLFSQACDALTGPGKIFVCAAGNNGQDHLHLQKNFTTNDTIVNTFVNFDPSLGRQNTWVDVWGDSAKPFCVQLSLYNNTAIDSTGFVCLDNNTHEYFLIGSNSDTCFVTLTTSSQEFNGKTRVYISLYSRVTDSVCLSIKSTDGQVNLWNGYVRTGEGYVGPLTTNGRAWATPGDSLFTVDDIATTNSAITAGAYASKLSFRCINGQTYTYQGGKIHALAPFSSIGPTVDGRIKPDITAPGFGVVSSVNSFDSSFITVSGANFSSTITSYHSTLTGRNYYFAILAGTSMASPATSGIVALMLQANPNLTPTEIRTILAQTAIQDTFTGHLPIGGNNYWGPGKINAYRAVIEAAALSTSVTVIPGATLACNLFPNPNKGNFTLQYTSNLEDNLNVEVFDLDGQLMFKDEWKVAAGTNNKRLDISKLSSGVYLTRVSSAQGSALIRTAVVK